MAQVLEKSTSEAVMQATSFDIVGVSDIILHNNRTADPTDCYSVWAKSITTKKNKSIADHELLKRGEFEGALYMDPFPEVPGRSEVVIPARAIRKSLIEGAKKLRLGKILESGAISILEQNIPLVYEPAEDVGKIIAPYVSSKFNSDNLPLAEYDRFYPFYSFSCPEKVGNVTVIRTRPIFEFWSLHVEIVFDPSMISLKQIEQITHYAGKWCGLGDKRKDGFGKYVAANWQTTYEYIPTVAGKYSGVLAALAA